MTDYQQPAAGDTAGVTTLVGVFDQPGQLETARNLLGARGIGDDQVRTMIADRAAGNDGPGASEEAGGAAAGAAIGTVLGAFAGPFFPIGTVVGGIVGWLGGLGIPDEEARHYGGAYDSGQPVAIVRVYPNQVDDARQALAQAGARPPTDAAPSPDAIPASNEGAATRAVGDGPRHPEILEAESGRADTLEPNPAAKKAR